jgi:hypothetical protein
MRLLKYVLQCEQHFSYFDPDYPISRLIVTELSTVYCILNMKAARSSKTLITMYHAKRRHMPQYTDLHDYETLRRAQNFPKILKHYPCT